MTPHHRHRTFSENVRALSRLTRLCARLTGTSLAELAQAPESGRNAVHLAALSLVLAAGASGLGLWFALGIARGEYRLGHLPYAVLVGVIVYALDRAMLRAHWHRCGRRAASARGFRLYERRPTLAIVGRWTFRIAVSLVISLTIASFLELALFRQDIDAYLQAQHRRHNQSVYRAATKRVKAHIESKKQALHSLNRRAARLQERARAAQSKARAARRARRRALLAERAKLLSRKRELSHTIDCQTRNMIAEKTGTVRCDGEKALAGKGNNWAAARARVRYARHERARVVARLQAIHKALARLQSGAGAPIPPAIQAQLERIAARRAAIQESLRRLIHHRAHRIDVLAKQNPAYRPMPHGLIVRGEALVALARQSPWLARRILAVTLFLMVLDLVAVVVMIIQPAPTKLLEDELAVVEIGMAESLAHTEALLGRARQRFLQARQAAVAAEAEFERQISRTRQAAKARELVDDQLDAHVMNRFNRPD